MVVDNKNINRIRTKQMHDLPQPFHTEMKDIKLEKKKSSVAEGSSKRSEARV